MFGGLEQNAYGWDYSANAMDVLVSRKVEGVFLARTESWRIIAFDFLFFTFFNCLLEKFTSNGVQFKNFSFGICDEENLSL